MQGNHQPNHRRQRTPRERQACISRQWRKMVGRIKVKECHTDR